MSEETPEIVWVDVVITCRTDGCPSNGRAVSLTVPADCSAFVCGACGQQTTDVSGMPGVTPNG